MESIQDLNFDYEDNPYLNYSFKELSKLLKRERINNAIIEQFTGNIIPIDSNLKKAYRIKKNSKKKLRKRQKRIQNKIQVIISKALQNNVISYNYIDHNSPNFLKKLKSKIIIALNDAIRKFGSIKVNLSFIAMFIKDERTIEIPISVPGRSAIIINMADINNLSEIYDRIYNSTIATIDDMPMIESGCIFLRITGAKLIITKNSGMAGSQYIELPKWIKDKKAVLNIKNNDDLCFLW
jgi:hypothetical protein